jgi:phage-related protein
LGIAKALGASEEHARNFSYALGTATYWAIQIAKSVGTLVGRIVEVVSGGESINNAFGSTSERIISLVTVISEFLEGFFEGWTGGFDGIISAVESLMPTISNTLSEIGRLFDNIFGKGEEDVDDFYKTLEPGTDSGISRAGEKLGEIVATLLEYAVRGFTLVVDVVGRITGAIADLVKAYNEGGIEGLLTELGNKLSGVWDFLLAGATLLWEDKIKPALSTAIEKTSNWLKTTGKDLLVDAATTLWGAFTSVAGSILLGKAVTIQRPVEKTVTSMLSYTAKEGDNLLDIARKHNTSVNKIRAANKRLFEGYYVWPGESIMIPMEETISTVEPETLQFPGILGQEGHL